MQIKTREKKYGSKYSVIKKDIVNSSINLDTFTLDLMCRYVLSSNNTIRRGQLINLRNLIYSGFFFCLLRFISNHRSDISYLMKYL